MRLYEVLFYIIAAVTLTATTMAITRRNLVHAVIYLVVSFFGTAMLFYLFGAPLLAALEIIIYAGAIMVLFLFIIMMLRTEITREQFLPLRQWVPAAVMALVYLAVGGVLVGSDPDSKAMLLAAVALPRDFGRFLFERHWLSIEIVSLVLLVALVGALYLGKTAKATDDEKKGEHP